MNPSPATSGQIQRLQVLYGQICARSIGVENTREARLAWAEELVKRPVASFKDLTLSEAAHMIDAVQAELGIKGSESRRYMSRDQAQRAGRDGRHDAGRLKDTPQMVRAEDVDKIQRLLLQLGWDQAAYERWLHSPRSPLKSRANPKVITTADANKVIWALKGMLRRKGKAA